MQVMNAYKGVNSASGPYLDEQLAGDLRNRFSRIEGHIRGIKKMLEEGRECDELVIQLTGVGAALQQATIRLLEGHLDTCLRDALPDSDTSPSIERFKTSMKRVLRARMMRGD